MPFNLACCFTCKDFLVQDYSNHRGFQHVAASFIWHLGRHIGMVNIKIPLQNLKFHLFSWFHTKVSQPRKKLKSAIASAIEWKKILSPFFLSRQLQPSKEQFSSSCGGRRGPWRRSGGINSSCWVQLLIGAHGDTQPAVGSKQQSQKILAAPEQVFRLRHRG